MGSCGAGVKCMTEEAFVAASGNREQSGHADPTAKKWADKMTEHYGELAVAVPIFGELRNCMELAVVGALLRDKGLIDRAGCRLPTMLDGTPLKLSEYNVPKYVDSKVSMLQRGRNWIISASGGVAIRPMEIVEKAQSNAATAKLRTGTVLGGGKQWYWN